MSITHPRGTSNSNTRGSSATRARRRLWLVAAWGDGETAPCFFCGTSLTVHTVTTDRIVPGIQEGRYVRGNIRPACLSCNSTDGNKIRRGSRLHAGFTSGRRRLLVGQRVTIQFLLRETRFTYVAIAREVGCHPDTVSRIARSISH